MKRRSVTLVPLLLVTGYSAFARDFRFIDLQAFDRRHLFAQQEEDGRLTITRFRERIDIERQRSSNPSLFAPISEVSLASDRLLAIEQADSEQGIATPSSMVDLVVAGLALNLILLERVYDGDFNAYHLGFISSDSADYIRLTVSAIGDEVIGTVYSSAGQYRILPASDQTQWVYPVGMVGRPARMSTPSTTARISELEARHLQLTQAAEIKPKVFQTSSDGRAQRILGANLGNIYLGMRRGSGSTIELDKVSLALEAGRLFREIETLTLASEHLDFEVVSASFGRSNLAFVRLRQLIDGVPIAGSSVLMLVRPSGEVEGVAGLLAGSEHVPIDDGRWIDSSEARRIALDAHASSIGFGAVTVIGEEFGYEYATNEKLEPFWRLGLLDQDGNHYAARVNAATGFATSAPTAQHSNRQVCVIDDAGAGLQNSCEQSGVTIVLEDHGSGKICTVSPDCNAAYNNHAYDLALEIENSWQDGFGPCCGQFPSAALDIVLKSGASNAPYYDPSSLSDLTMDVER